MAYGPVQAQDVAGLFDAGFASMASRTHSGTARRKRFRISRSQQRLTFARVGHHRPAQPRRLHRARRLSRPEGRARDARPPTSSRAVTASGLRGRGGAAFPAGIKWKTVLGAAGGAKIRRLQRRRRRFGHLLRSHADGGRPLRAHRGHDHRGLRHRRHPRLHLSALGIPASQDRARGGHRGSLCRALSGREHPRQRQALRPGSAHGRRRLHLRRGNLAAGIPGRQARPGALQAAAAGHCRVCSASPP